MSGPASALVTTEWLAAHLGRGTSASSTARGTCRSSAATRERVRRGAHPGRVVFDIDAVADTRTALPHMLPSARRSRGT